MPQLDALKKLTLVVADTGDIDSIKKFSPEDATTNPSLIYKAVQMPQYSHLVEDAIKYGKGFPAAEQVERTMDKICVNFGVEISKIVPGVVSTEVDARLSFDTEATIKKAKELCELYTKAGVDPKEKVLIKIASTWEGFEAARALEKEGIRTNLTLLFSFAQALAAADAGCFLISPFVGRITDWYKKAEARTDFPPVEEDKGVLSVRKIYNYYKKFGIKTVVMGASFRHAGQVLALAGCDRLTIGPNFLAEMQGKDGDVPQKLDAKSAQGDDIEKVPIDEKSFRWMMNEDAMATEKLAEGIRGFAKDIVLLEGIIKEKLK
jgi:transaldolase